MDQVGVDHDRHGGDALRPKLLPGCPLVTALRPTVENPVDVRLFALARLEISKPSIGQRRGPDQFDQLVPISGGRGRQRDIHSSSPAQRYTP